MKKMIMTQPTPSFANPPIWEVVISVMTHSGIMSEYDVKGFHTLIADQYPNIEMQPPIENLDPLPRIGPMPIQAVSLVNSGIERRWWFRDASDELIVQVQSNLISLNWRRRLSQPGMPSSYPGFDVQMDRYKELVTIIRKWHESSGRNMPEPISGELIYDNLIVTDVSDKPTKLADFLTFVNSNSSDPLKAGWQCSWLEEVAGAIDVEKTTLGVNIASAGITYQNETAPVGVIKLLFVSRSPLSTWENAFAFFEAAHANTYNRFTALTTDTARAKWNTL